MPNTSEEFFAAVETHINSGVERDELTNDIINPNPHRLTNRALLGLDRVENIAKMSMPVSSALTSELDGLIDKSSLFNDANWGINPANVDPAVVVMLQKRPLSAARAAALKNAIDSLANINTQVNAYKSRLAVLEGKLGVTA